MLLIAGLHHLRILGPTGRGVHIGDDMYITNESAQVDKLLSRELRLAIGGSESHSLVTNGTAAYLKTSKNEPDDGSAVRVLTAWLALLRSFFMAIWLVRDNSVNCELGFLEHEVPGQGTTHASNFIAALFSTARGTIESIPFSIEEIRQASEYFRSFFFPVMLGLQPDTGYVRRLSPGDLKRPAVVSAKGVHRLQRLSFFLSAARSAPDLGVKVSLYMICLEILFSTETTELTHRLAERVAYFLYDNPSDRLVAYQRVKRGYNVRSKVIHGSVLSEAAQKDLADVSVEIDDVLRQVVHKIISEEPARRLFDMDAARLEDYFTRLTIGMPASD